MARTSSQPAGKRARHDTTSSRPALPEELREGAVVLFENGTKRGIVKDAYAALDEFWVNDEATGHAVRGSNGGILSFRAQDLILIKAPEPVHANTDRLRGATEVRVMLFGSATQMLDILENFGEPNTLKRVEPAQQLLAFPCDSCECGPRCARYDQWNRDMCEFNTCNLSQVAMDAVDKRLWPLARSLRADIQVNLRPYHLKQAIQRSSAAIKQLDGFYALSCVTLPFGQREIDAVGGAEKRWREEGRCQVDIGVSGECAVESGDATHEDTARRALERSCRVRLDPRLWSEELQLKLRRKAGTDLPLKLLHGSKIEVFMILLPANASSRVEDGRVVFEAEGMISSRIGEKDWASMSIKDWENHQDQFKDLPKLPTNWIRVRSRKNGSIYFWDTKNNKPTFEIPLPDGWTKQISKGTGKIYYFNASLRKSTFEIPTE
eukprot:TRINITY_DN13111_c0_g1_i1.p1 TRINITY_DN13111_c0_g1~~TRINITY_DN13111_c0_g1_i1.p1  ORF type:complete len:455 (+),score=69.91 TRINITY_DN13111_c0_g1_i1:59-1366(+)